MEFAHVSLAALGLMFATAGPMAAQAPPAGIRLRRPHWPPVNS